MKKRDDLDFNEFEEILKKRLEHIQDNIAGIQSELDEVCSDDGINDMEDLASLNSMSSKDNIILDQQENELKETLHALEKIKNGTYGICEKSAEPIPLERLRANPTARHKVGIED